MLGRGLLCGLAAAGLVAAAAQAAEEARYPDFKGQWERASSTRWGPGRTNATAPLTAEYRAIYNANVADMEAGGQGDDPTYRASRPACRAT
jgi:hypothetical protein